MGHGFALCMRLPAVEGGIADVGNSGLRQTLLSDLVVSCSIVCS